jgi:hypothetical protein
MGPDVLEARAHELLGQLEPGKLAAVVHLLEVMVQDAPEPVTDDDRSRLRIGEAWFAENGGNGIPMDQVLAEFGLTSEDFPSKK